MELFITLYKVVPTFQSVDEILILSATNTFLWRFIMLYKVYLTFESVDEILSAIDPIRDPTVNGK